jgi:hypothetical protein
MNEWPCCQLLVKMLSAISTEKNNTLSNCIEVDITSSKKKIPNVHKKICVRILKELLE